MAARAEGGKGGIGKHGSKGSKGGIGEHSSKGGIGHGRGGIGEHSSRGGKGVIVPSPPDSSLRDASHELAHNTMLSSWTNVDTLIPRYDSHLRAEAMADLVSALAIIRSGLATAEEVCMQISQVWCERLSLAEMQRPDPYFVRTLLRHLE